MAIRGVHPIEGMEKFMLLGLEITLPINNKIVYLVEIGS
jgi:hypothetical protein